jgi:spore germination protein GerM
MMASIATPVVRMRLAMTLLALLTIAVAINGAWWWHESHLRPSLDDKLSVYYTLPDGSAEASWSVALGPAHDRPSVAFFAATQAIAGPPSGIDAVRFPQGTYVRSADLSGSTVTVDLSKEVDGLAGGSFREAATFKSLVWTMTAVPGIASVIVRVNGARVATIPGGHFELDEPLTRSSW